MDPKAVGWGEWTRMIWLRIGTNGGHFKRSNERSNSIKYREHHDCLRTGSLLKMDSAPWSE